MRDRFDKVTTPAPEVERERFNRAFKDPARSKALISTERLAAIILISAITIGLTAVILAICGLGVILCYVAAVGILHSFGLEF